MNDVQQRAAAAGFIHALHTSPELFNEWMGTKKDDDVAIGKLVQKTLGLAQAPDKQDLHAMATYIDAHLKDEVTKFHAAHPTAPHHVGIAFLMQQS
ncbi:MAG: hypothetical protein WBG27_04175 [Candidatus Aquilonibacter sp.]|jgi:hypothetical protein